MISELALQLKDADGNILWGFDSTHCGRSIVTREAHDATSCAARELIKATQKDGRLSDANLPETIPVGTTATPEEAAKIGARIEAALRDAKERHPDFDQYEEAMKRIAAKIRPGDTSPSEYVEMLCSLAKAEKASTF